MKKFFSLFATSMALFSLASCNSVDLSTDTPQGESSFKHTCQMVFNGEVSGFDNTIAKSSVSTKATSSSWSDGDKVYIIFYNGTEKVPGEATYSTSNGWTVSYDGDLATGASLKCEVRYFVNATFSSPSLVSLNSGTEIYETTNGTYDYTGSQVTVTATMTPKTGRIRFNGTSSSEIYLTGITVYSTYAPATNTFSTTNAMIKSTVASSGSTPYIYGYFSSSDCTIGLVGSDFAFTRNCSSSIFQAGDSGYMAIPSESSHNKWKTGLYVKVNGVEFKMIPVAGLSSGFFMIGETEVTEALYAAATSSTSSTSTYPKVNISYNNWEAFVTKINYITDLTFAVPDSDQWLFAAKGGNKSQGYTYSGSNNPGDVAWYAGNSGSALHKVKQLAPNELGIYDMSGNAAECTTKLYNSYYNYGFGGCYSDVESSITTTSSKYVYYYQSGYAKYLGLRLVLTCK